MTNLNFLLDSYQRDAIFVPFRRRFDVLSTWMNVIKLLIAYYPPPSERVSATVVLRVSRMSRIFLISEGKTASVAFPFKYEQDGDDVFIRTHSGRELDNRLSSEILALISFLDGCSAFDALNLLDFCDQNGDLSEDFWPVFFELLDAEDGYLRFDHDPVNEKGRLHPLDHADLFYTNSATFKLGLNKKMNIQEMIHLLDIETDCHYLSL